MCGRADHVVEPEQRMIGRRRLDRDDVERGRGNATRAQRVLEGCLVDHPSPPRVHDHGPFGEERKRLPVEQPPRLVRQRDVHGHGGAEGAEAPRARTAVPRALPPLRPPRTGRRRAGSPRRPPAALRPRGRSGRSRAGRPCTRRGAGRAAAPRAPSRRCGRPARPVGACARPPAATRSRARRRPACSTRGRSSPRSRGGSPPRRRHRRCRPRTG